MEPATTCRCTDTGGTKTDHPITVSVVRHAFQHRRGRTCGALPVAARKKGGALRSHRAYRVPATRGPASHAVKPDG